LNARTLAAIRAALEAAGVEFIEENGGGKGEAEEGLMRIFRPELSAQPEEYVSDSVPLRRQQRGNIRGGNA
jgi:hypothetical protein